jgi:hypothetical protein
MKKHEFNSIKTMELKSLETIFNTATEIQSELDFAGSNEIFYTLNPFLINYERKAKGINWLGRFGAIKAMAKTLDGDNLTGVKLTVDEEKLLTVIDQIEKRMIELSKRIANPETADTTIKSMTMSYKPNTRTFCVAENSFTLGENTKQADLCKVTLKDSQSIKKTWSWDEILEEWGWKEDRIYEKPTRVQQLKVHNAAKLFNARLDKESKHQIGHFFITTMKTVRVNPKYLPKIN